MSIALTLSLLDAAHSVAAPLPITFEEAFEQLQNHNETLAAAGREVDQARADLGEARARRWPTAGLGAQALYWDDPITLHLEDVRVSVPGLPIPVQSVPLPVVDVQINRRNASNVVLTASQPLYAGGRIQAGIRAANAAVAAAEAQRNGQHGSLLLELVQRYFGHRLATQSVAVRRTTADSLSRHLDNARKLEREGQIARAERLRAEVALADAQRELLTAQRQEDLARRGLAALLATSDELLPVTAIPAPPPPESLESLTERALRANPQLTRAAEQKTRAEQGMIAARGEFAPAIGLFALGNLYSHDPILREPDWAIGVRLDWPLFDGFQRRSRLQAARAQLEQVDLLAAAGRRDVALLVAQRYLTLADALDQVRSYETTRALADESLRAQQRAFAEGLATSLDVVDAQLALSRVKLGILSAHFDAAIAQAGLFEACGEAARIREFVASAPSGEGAK